MKYLLIFLMLFGVAYAQEPTYTPMKGNYKFKGIRVDSLFLIPSFTDTTAANATNLDAIAGAMIRTGNDFWMRNAATNAWLQNVNVGDGSSPVGAFVNSVFKKTATDSVFYVIAPADTTFAYLSGGGATDSPDRINGTATVDVTADMDGLDFNIKDANHIQIEADITYLSANNELNISSGNQINITTDKRITLGPAGAANQIGNVLYAYAKTGIDLTVANDTAHIPGTYQILKGTSTYSFWLPDAAQFPGQVIYIINIDGTQADIFSLGGNILDVITNAIASVGGNRFMIFTSDGVDWYGGTLN